MADTYGLGQDYPDDLSEASTVVEPAPAKGGKSQKRLM